MNTLCFIDNFSTSCYSNSFTTIIGYFARFKFFCLFKSNKNKYYKETQFWYDAKKASDLFNDFHNYLIYKKLFIDDKLFAGFASVEFALNNILAGIQYAKQQHDDSAEGLMRERLNWDIYPVMQKIEQMIKDRINQNFPLKGD